MGNKFWNKMGDKPKPESEETSSEIAKKRYITPAQGQQIVDQLRLI